MLYSHEYHLNEGFLESVTKILKLIDTLDHPTRYDSMFNDNTAKEVRHSLCDILLTMFKHPDNLDFIQIEDLPHEVRIALKSEK